MVLMVRSYRSSTLSIFQWVSFSLLILLSTFAIYCVECKTSYDLAVYQRRHIVEETETDLLPTDLVLVFTLDGSIRGLDRYDGRCYWTLQGGNQSSLIKADSQFETHETSLFKNQKENHNIIPGRRDNENPQSPQWESEPEQELYYIVEPQEGGNLYIYGDGRPLEKLPFSIKDIVAESPIRTKDGITYMGQKNTVMIAINARTGAVLQRFDFSEENSYLSLPSQKLGPGTIFVGRNEYKVLIYDDKSRKLLNVTYSEYVPSRQESDVPMTRPPSDIYIAPNSAGSIMGINITNGNMLWPKDLPYPVVDVFDVYRRKDFSIALYRQEAPRSLNYGPVGEMLQMIKRPNGLTTAYVGVHEGSLYAMSTKNYPLVQLSSWASIYTGQKPTEGRILIEDTANSGSRSSCCQGCEHHMECIVGQHMVDYPAIDGSSVMSEYPTKMPIPEEQKPGFFDEGFGKFWKSYILVSAVIVYVYKDHMVTFYQVKVLPKWKQIQKKRAKVKKTRAKLAAAIQVERENIKRAREIKAGLKKQEIKHEPEQGFETERESSGRQKKLDKRKKKKKQEPESEPDSDQGTESDSEQELKSEKRIKVVKTTSAGLDLEKFKQSKSKVLEISETVLGYGSHGTIVYKGQFDGREVAVKRLLVDFYDVALKEVKLLQESDDHPNVVRYFYKEQSDRFLYIALELCYGSLNDYMERSLSLNDMTLCDTMNPADILSQMVGGIQYLHSLKIVHRDIKPHNILLAPTKYRSRDSPVVRILISDFGLCKKLDGEQSSFNFTAASPAGTSGWRAPELLAGALATFSDNSQSSSDPTVVMAGRRVKATRAIDVFSAGCVFYYVLSRGDHPFGNRFGRENNILNNDYDLSKLDSMGEDGVEAKDLVERMISTDPRARPRADLILSHPFFWSTAKRLSFLQDASDRFEIEERDPPSPLLLELESDAQTVIGTDWYKKIDRIVANDLGKFRKYDGKRVRDLLRALRNKVSRIKQHKKYSTTCRNTTGKIYQRQ
ncbi:hypothetical protein BY458DRAFT_514231 [Sporodiniella umbellata]|nr:hypothetical protein BY458DRAFT_514231 [Sporodiniella umbellata]